MPTWSGILQEITQEISKNNSSAFDHIRRKYLLHLNQHTNRDTILYATKFTQADPTVPSFAVSITDEDLQGIMEVIHGLKGPNLDLILHSPGGSIEAAEALVRYLRSKFDHIRVIVPQMAMSAATLIACSANEIVLGKHSFLGPIDPQLMMSTPVGKRMVPAEAVTAQFEKAQKECSSDPRKMGAWAPMLAQYGPDLLIQCQNVEELSKSLAQEWLESYMFSGNDDGKVKAAKVAEWLVDNSHFKTHGRHISRGELEERELNITYLENDQSLQDLVLSVFHATTHTFVGSPAVKIIENHSGSAFIQVNQPQVVPQPRNPNPVS